MFTLSGSRVLRRTRFILLAAFAPLAMPLLFVGAAQPALAPPSTPYHHFPQMTGTAEAPQTVPHVIYDPETEKRPVRGPYFSFIVTQADEDTFKDDNKTVISNGRGRYKCISERTEYKMNAPVLQGVSKQGTYTWIVSGFGPVFAKRGGSAGALVNRRLMLNPYLLTDNDKSATLRDDNLRVTQMLDIPVSVYIDKSADRVGAL